MVDEDKAYISFTKASMNGMTQMFTAHKN